ncbi:MAG: tetratricopeptide repeat protein [Shewanella sp.]
MASLGFAMVGVLSAFAAWLFWQHTRLNLLQAAAQLPQFSPRLPLLGGSLLVLLTLAIYSQTGRYSDWDQGRVDDNIDYLVAAEITKAARTAKSEPQNPLALLTLAQAQSAGGQYAQAVVTLDKVLALGDADAEVLGAKANALYYREQRQMTAEIEAVISQALALSPFEVQTRMLLATDAYLHARYQDAIDHWQLLLAQPSGAINRDALHNAIQKAQMKLNENGNTSSR